MDNSEDKLIIAGRSFSSRLLIGTGKFPSGAVMKEAIEASGSEIVTVALRRVDLTKPEDPFLTFIDQSKFLLLPNTSGARNAQEAVRLAKLARASGMPNWIKLEVIPDPRYLLPDPVETLKAAEELVKDGFTVLPYINADPVLAKRLAELEPHRARPLIVYCRSGQRSGRAAVLLRRRGFQSVHNLAGGVLAWQGDSLPLRKA